MLLGHCWFVCLLQNYPGAGWHFARVVVVDKDRPSVMHPRINMLDMRQQFNVHLVEHKLNTATAEPGTWCWHVQTTQNTAKK